MPVRSDVGVGGASTRTVPIRTGLRRWPPERELGGSYLHTGDKDQIEDVVRFYVQMSGLECSGQLRNGARELRDMQITEADVAPLSAFLRTLNEDYE